MAVKKAAVSPAAPTQWLTIHGAAEYAQFSYAYIKAAIASGELLAHYPRNGRSVRIKAADVDAFICSGD